MCEFIGEVMTCLSRLSGMADARSFAQTWMSSAEKTLTEKERSLSDLSRLNATQTSCTEFVNDVIAHQADLRFITVAAQKYIDESKEYLRALNSLRTQLPQRLGHIEPHDYQVKQEVTEVTHDFQQLLSRANKLSDRLTSLASRQREYQQAMDRAEQWLKEADSRAHKVLTEPVAAEPRAVQQQLDSARQLSSQLVSQEKLIDAANQAAAQLAEALQQYVSPKEAEKLREPARDVARQHASLAEDVAERCRELDMALVQSQGVQDGLDSLMTWLNQAEARLKALQKPASLSRERLQEQIQEQRLLQSDVDQHQPSVDQIQRAAQQLTQTPSNARIAQKIETKVKELTQRYQTLVTKVAERGSLLDEVSVQTETFWSRTEKFDHWYVEIMDVVESHEVIQLNVESYAAKMDQVARQVDAQRPDYEHVVTMGTNLVNKKDVTDTAITKEKVKVSHVTNSLTVFESVISVTNRKLDQFVFNNLAC